MITQQTFDVRDNADELAFLSLLAKLISDGRDREALDEVVKRHDQLTVRPALRPYYQREARA